MNSVAEWLEALDLAQYADAFGDNAITWDLLADLTDQDLRELGVTALGHRKRLLKAAAELGSTPRPRELKGSAVPHKPAEAERRQLTVMFCDLVDSTAMSTRLDPEDMREVIRAYQETCGKIVARFDGFVARYMGDGLMIYFGYPRAHEDAAERAVRAGLGIVDAMPALNAGIGRDKRAELAVRIGIAAGRVVVGDIIGEGASEEMAVVGETPNLAARLQSVAGPNSVVVDALVHTLLGKLFTYRELGSHRLKGVSQPVAIWEVADVQLAESRFDAFRGGAHRSLVGREEETEALMRRWQRSLSGEGQIVLLSGDPGIGKSHIVQTFDERLAATPRLRINWQCVPYYANTALYPVISQIEREAAFERSDGPENKRTKLEKLLARTFNAGEQVVALLAALLSLPAGARDPLRTVNPEQLRSSILEALVEYLVAMTRMRPVLILLEDVHWSDPTTRELLDRLAVSLSQCRALLVITSRGEYARAWIDQPHVLLMRLNRLDPRESKALIEQRAGDRALPQSTIDQIVSKAEGVPLFVEELTQTVLATGRIEAIPATLQDSLVARLDRAGAARETAQIGAVIGREFAIDLLTAVTEQPADRVQSALDQLSQLELIHRQDLSPQTRYVFKHALIQEAAYDALLKSQRQQWHAKVAAVLQRRFPQQAALQPELLAHHYEAAGQIEPAVDFWQRASLRASERWDNLEALHHLEKALGAIGLLADDRARREARIDLCFLQERLYERLGQPDRQQAVISRLLEDLRSGDDQSRLAEAYVRQGDLNTRQEQFDQAERALHEALALSRSASDQAKESRALGSLAFLRWHQSRVQESLANHRAALAIERERKDPAAIAAVLINIGNNLRNIGEHQDALRHLQEALAMYEADRETFRAELHIPSTLFNIGHVHRELGDLERALDYYRRAYDYDVKERVLYAAPYALSSMAGVYWELGKTEESLSYYQQAADVARSLRLGEVQAQALQTLGDVLSILQRSPEALSSLKESAEVYAALNDRKHEATVWEKIAGLYERTLSELPKALQAWERVHDLRSAGGDHGGALTALEQSGRLCRELGDPATATAHLGAALNSAEELGRDAKCYELRNSLGILAWRQGDYETALEHYHAALKLSRRSDDAARSALMLNSLGATLRRMGRSEEALAPLEEALELSRRASQAKLEGHALALLGDLRRDLGSLEAALCLYRESQAIRERIGDRRGLGWMHYSQARVHKELASAGAARDHLTLALASAEACSDEELCQLCRGLELELAATR